MIRQLRERADAGDADAQWELGYAYHNGRGVPQDDTQSAAWFRKAAEQEEDDAQYSLGWAYANGRGVRQDDMEAVEWYRKAAERGHGAA